MAEHLIPITISVDDETIEKKAMEYASKLVAEEVMKATHIVSWSGSVNTKDFSPVLNMVEKEVKTIITKHEDEIVTEAIKVVADKLCKTKKCKELLAQLTSDESEDASND